MTIANFKVFEEPGGVRIEVLGRGIHAPGVTVEQMGDGWRKYIDDGEPIQNAFSFLDHGQRKFLMTGTTLEEWKALEDEADQALTQKELEEAFMPGTYLGD